VRKALGAAVTEQLVTTGLKLTPCHPSMITARDAIFQADAQITGGANRCGLWRAFASRQMGVGASSPDSPNYEAPSAIVLSTAVPDDCVVSEGVVRSFASTDAAKEIPDGDPAGATSVLDVAPSGLDLVRLTADIHVTHTFRADLVIQLIAPDGQVVTLSDQIGGFYGTYDDYIVTNLDLTSTFAPGTLASGRWKLVVRDLTPLDVGTIDSFTLHVTSTN